MVSGFAGSGFSYLSHRELDGLIEAVQRNVAAFPDIGVASELYEGVCRFLDDYEADPILGDSNFVSRSKDPAFGLLSTVRGYLRILSILEETDSLAFCNQFWEDCAIGAVAIDPVFEAVEQGTISSDRLATSPFNGGVEAPVEARPRRFATVFGGLPLLSYRPYAADRQYQNDLPRDLATAVNRTQLSELTRHLIADGELNPDIFWRPEHHP